MSLPSNYHIRRVFSRTETIVYGHLSKLILEDTDLPLVLLLENVIHKRRLPSAKEASNDCDGGEIVGGFGHDVACLCDGGGDGVFL